MDKVLLEIRFFAVLGISDHFQKIIRQL